MIYTNLTKKALKISFNAHKDQVDKTGVPYVFHPFHLAEQMDDEASTCVALLHDVVEDTDYTFDDLRNEGFTKEIIDAIKLLTHDPSVPYLDYINKIKENVISTKVKLADLKHNSDLSRLDLSVDKIPPKLELYLKAIKILKGDL
jgi:(p)ppGpp synthase/HD superfamily hydrolase